MPGALENYLHQLPVNVHAMQIERTYLWERHVTLKSFWRMLIHGREAGEPLLLLRRDHGRQRVRAGAVAADDGGANCRVDGFSSLA